MRKGISPIRKSLGLVILLAFSIGLLSGCAGRYVRTDYYENPTYTNQGKIICVRGIEEDTYNSIDVKVNQVYKEYLCVMSGESYAETLYDEVTDYVCSDLTFNPSLEIVAFRWGATSGVSRYIQLQAVPSQSYTGPEQITLSVPDCLSMDWNAEGDKIVYCNTDGEIRMINMDGSADTLVKDVDAVKVYQKYGSRILFEYSSAGTSETRLGMVNPDGNGLIYLSGTANITKCQICKTNPNHIYARQGDSYVKVDVTNYPTVTVTTLLANCTEDDPQLSNECTKIVYSRESALYVRDLATGAETKIKP